MTSVPAKLTGFAVLLLVAFGVAALAGGVLQPWAADDSRRVAADGDHAPATDGHGDAMSKAGDHGAAASTGDHGDPASTAALPGLAVADGGLRLVLDDPRRSRAGRTPLRFRIVDEHGEPVRDFAVEHDRRMHLIVVRRDLSGFIHLHPAIDADGTWSATANLARAGSYRVFADFRTGGAKRTLGADLQLAGDVAPRPLPQPAAATRTASGLDVALHRHGDRFSFSVSRDGRALDDELEPYLGAKGHLVALRAGDLAYLHTHPVGDELAFDAPLPSAGAYRLWLQFRLARVVHTAAFTVQERS